MANVFVIYLEESDTNDCGVKVSAESIGDCPESHAMGEAILNLIFNQENVQYDQQSHFVSVHPTCQ